MTIDPFEDNASPDEGTHDNVGGNDDNVTAIGTSDEWNTFRDNLAQTMFDSWNTTNRCLVEKSRNYRTSTTHEDAKLVEAMLNMANAGPENWRNKSLPHYDDLCIIFGKDRAQGNRVEDCEVMSHNETVEEELLKMEDDFNEKSEEISSTANRQSEETSSANTKKRKHKFDPFIEGISKVVTLLGKDLREVSATMSQSLNAEAELQKKTSMVTSEILKIPSMDQRDKFKASRKIMHETEAVLTFWNLEGEERETFVKLMLEE
ncbi:unnamed protein product [Lactuca saligna]|uniref:Uncharacterized protein n=1 Tax=Lactuca saligna TaxID=75948 RepID=A0AA36E2Y2_LACSI|nr:unnamed protein product [Lactuca saligna]